MLTVQKTLPTTGNANSVLFHPVFLHKRLRCYLFNCKSCVTSSCCYGDDINNGKDTLIIKALSMYKHQYMCLYVKVFVRDTRALEIHPYNHHSGAKFRSCVHNSAMETNDRVSFLEHSLFTSHCALYEHARMKSLKSLHHSSAQNFSAKPWFI